MIRLLLATSLLCAVAVADMVTILKPPTRDSVEAAVILMPGAQISHTVYAPLGKAIQSAAAQTTGVPSTWVAILGYVGDVPQPVDIGPRIDYLLGEMKDQGLDTKTVKLFYGGHSLGSVFIQDHLFKYHGKSGPMGGSIEVLGQVLMGGFIQRKYLQPSFSYPVPTLTIGGEVDGLARVTRLAESVYQQRNITSAAAFPVVVLQGVSHMQFASGDPPALVKARDLQPEVTLDAAHGAAAQLIAAFMAQRMNNNNDDNNNNNINGRGGGSASTVIQQAVAATADLVAPIVAAYEQEGGRNFNVPAQFGGPMEKQGCTKGGCPGSSSPWAPTAQQVISGDLPETGWTVDVSNEYVQLSSTPPLGAFHLPVVTNDTSTRKVGITTYSECYWDDAQPSWFKWKEIFDDFDTGFIATSALEIGTKLASRQCTLIHGLGYTRAQAQFNETDAPDFCMRANQQALEWAMKRAGAKTLARYQQYGQKLVMGKDVPEQGGPFWLDNRLRFDEVADPTNSSAGAQKIIEVSSPMQKTEIDYWPDHFHIPRPSAIPDPGCYHYCKLLSPARAMEWIYVDSLRLNRNIHG